MHALFGRISWWSIIDQFLDWVQKNRAAETYFWYQGPLQLFARRYPELVVKRTQAVPRATMDR